MLNFYTFFFVKKKFFLVWGCPKKLIPLSNARNLQLITNIQTSLLGALFLFFWHCSIAQFKYSKTNILPLKIAAFVSKIQL